MTANSESMKHRAVRARLANAVRHRIADRIFPPPDPRPATPYEYLFEIRERLSVDDQHLLGCGLLSTADVTLEVTRGHRTMRVNPAMDAIVASVIKTGGYGDDEIARVSAHVRAQRPSS